ncbi:YggT family protein [Halorhodospira halochloris]|uniref:YggT family protein n=1 Tax=Halorhodospira halochloris TaxID=1052 RepID=UPI001EE84631|nr:YggT family protein [Halorhodospira halochloris]MCG5529422.1 YggT family protein [Halorhodospira halochloris]
MGSSYFTDPLIFLIGTAFYLYILAVMLRFLLQAVRADFFNPISQFLVRATSPTLNPLRRVIPSVYGIDLAAIVLMLALQVAAISIVSWLYFGQQPAMVPLLLESISRILGLLLNLYTILILVGVIISWVNPTASHPGLNLLYQLTNPVLRPIRSLLPDMGGLDLSPLVALILIHVARMMLVYPLRGQVPVPI